MLEKELDNFRMFAFELALQCPDALLEESRLIIDSLVLIPDRLDPQGMHGIVDPIDHPAVRFDQVNGSIAAPQRFEIQVKGRGPLFRIGRPLTGNKPFAALSSTTIFP